jgi:hypothetical protein
MKHRSRGSQRLNRATAILASDLCPCSRPVFLFPARVPDRSPRSN